jgi:hypothetical protein
VELRNIKAVKDRKGHTRYYFQVKGRALVRLPDAPVQSEEFRAAWEAARAAKDEMPPEAIRKALAAALRKASGRARSRGREVSVSVADLERMYRLQRGRCALTGMPLGLARNPTGGARNPWTLSIDRIDSTAGYIAGNVHLVTTMANVAKAEFSMSDFRKMCLAVAEHYAPSPVNLETPPTACGRDRREG